MTKQTLLDLESMQDDVLDDFEEAPDFINPPAGDYKLKTISGKITTFTQDDGDVTQSYTITFAVVKTLETVDDEPPVPDGSLFNKRFKGTVDGIQQLKREAKKYLGLDSSQGMSLAALSEALAEEVEFYGRISYGTFNGKEFLKLRVMPAPAE